MESQKIKSQILPPNPATERGFASPFVVSTNGEWLGYIVRNTVVLRSLSDLKVAKTFNMHRYQVTSLCFHPEGKLAASADIHQNIYIWYIDDCTDKKKIENAMAGKIIGMDFTEDGTKLFFYGEGKKTLARCINWDTNSNCGEFTNNSRRLLTGDLTKKKPYYAILGGEDGFVNFYKGPPFKYVHMQKEHQGNFVTCAKFSPDSTKFVSVGFDKKIVLYNGADANIIDTIAKEKQEGNHTMAIISCCWLDNDRFITASLDKTIKIWSVAEKKCTMTLKPAEKLGIPNMMCGVATNGKVICALTLNGIINIWNLEGLTDGKLPDYTIDGHQAPITKLLYVKSTKEVISSDSNGKVLLWPENGFPKLVTQKDKKIVTMALSNDESLLYIVEAEGTFLALDRATFEVKFELKSLGSDPQTIVPSRKTNDTVYVLYWDTVISILNGAVKATKKLVGYEATVLEVNEEAGEVLIGDKKGKLHILDMNFEQKSVSDFHFGEFSAMKLSPDNKLIASGDSQKYIKVWDAVTKAVVNDRCGFHSAKIFELNWSENSQFLISASLDESVMLWKMENKSRLKNYPCIDGDQINSAVIINENNDFVCGGYSCTIEKVTVE